MNSQEFSEVDGIRLGQERLHGILESQTNYVIRTNLSGQYTYWNKKFADTFGWIHGSRSLEGLDPMKAICEYHHQRTREAVETCLMNPGSQVNLEIDKPARDGGILSTFWEFVCITDSENHPVEIQCIGIDITELKRAEKKILNLNADLERTVRERTEELANEKRRLDQIIRGTRTGTWEWKVQTGEAVFNERWAEILGYTLAELEPVDITTWSRLTHPDDLRLSMELNEKHFRGELDYYECETRMRHKDGHWVWIMDRGCVSEWDDQGKPVMMSGTHQDITNRKTAEIELVKAKEEAEKANLAKSEFLSRMSHELRTPLNSILGFAQILDNADLSPALKKGVGHILSSGKHLLNLINEVLDLSRIESGRLALSPQSIEMGEVIGEIVDLVQPLVFERNLTIEVKNDPHALMEVYADRQRLRQVLLNLISNAIKYNRQGGTVTITARPEPDAGSGDPWVSVSVTDTGPGIPEGQISRLFTPFERVGAEKTGTEGSGLGLSVSRKLIEAMGGKIGVVSKEGTGSTFWFDLPVNPGDQQDGSSAPVTD